MIQGRLFDWLFDYCKIVVCSCNWFIDIWIFWSKVSVFGLVNSFFEKKKLHNICYDVTTSITNVGQIFL